MTMAGWLGRVQAGQGLTPPCLSFPITVTAQNYPAVTPGLEGDSCSLQKKSRNPGVLRSAVKPHIPVVMPVCPWRAGAMWLSPQCWQGQAALAGLHLVPAVHVISVLSGAQNRSQNMRPGTCSHRRRVKCQGRGAGDRMTETPGAGRIDERTWRQENKQRALAISAGGAVPGFGWPDRLVPSTPLFIAAFADASVTGA